MTTQGPLANLKILDFTQLLPGPFCSLLLADMGAEVLKIEPPRGDALRWLPLLEGQNHLVFAWLNRNKESMVLDLKDPASQKILGQLLATFDIVIEGFRPGVMQRLGLDYETLRRINPRLIYCSITGYGQQGPLANKAGHDLNYISRSGLATHFRCNEQLLIPAVQLADLTGAHQAALGILAAWIHRAETGEGQHVDISLMDAACSLLGMEAAVAFNQAQTTSYPGPLTGAFPHYRFFRCADERYVAVAALEPHFQQNLLKAMRLDQLEHAELEMLFASHSREWWLKELANTDTCVDPVLEMADLTTDPQLLARQMIIEVDGLQQLGTPMKFSRTPGVAYRPAPALGENHYQQT